MASRNLSVPAGAERHQQASGQHMLHKLRFCHLSTAWTALSTKYYFCGMLESKCKAAAASVV
jgi:hypothetical protein